MGEKMKFISKFLLMEKVMAFHGCISCGEPYLEVAPFAGRDISAFIPPQRLCPMTRMFFTCEVNYPLLKTLKKFLQKRL